MPLRKEVVSQEKALSKQLISSPIYIALGLDPIYFHRIVS